jgi:hypothetical protein
MKIKEYNICVIYGLHKGLNQWHIAAIIPINFTIEQTAHLTNIAITSVSLATGTNARVFYYSKDAEFPLFIEN